MTPDQRYKAMAHNRGRTKPEVALATALWRRGLRYLTHKGYQRRYGRGLPGHPDLVFVGKRVIVFVDGCFWHGCPTCDTGVNRSSEFWRNKIAANEQRDRRITEQLEEEGWRVIRILEHDVRTKAILEDTADRLAGLLRSLDGELKEKR